ncbi:MAG: glycosyltransferase family 1 protein [Chloroflexota bacterium]
MRIGFDGTPLQYIRSGVGIYAEQLLRHLPLARPEWEYLLYTNKPFTVNGIPGVRPVAGYFPRSRWVWMQFKLPQIIPHSDVDLCHFMNNSAPLRSISPYVITIHDASLFLYRQYHPWSRLVALRLLLPEVARRSQAVITISQASRQDLIRMLRLPPEKVHLVHIAASRDFRPLCDKEKRLRLQQKYHLPSKFVLYVGTIEPRKNLLRLIAAFARIQADHPDCHLVLVGPEGWMMNGALEKKTIAANLSGKVHYLGFVAQADLPGIYSLATLFAFPSLYEGFGLPLLEAMACGTPVLTSNCSAMPEVSGTAAYLVDPNSVDSIANGLSCLLNSPAQREWYREQGLVRVQQFSWERTARETAAVYEQILAGQS